MHQYFYRKDDQQFGPFSLEELKKESLTPGTYIWYYGLEKWELLQDHSDLMEALFQESSLPQEVGNISVPPPRLMNKQQRTVRPELPKNWMLENILITVFCCFFPIGIVGIIYSSQVGNLYFQNQYEQSFNKASKAEKWFYYAVIANIMLIFVVFIRSYIKL